MKIDRPAIRDVVTAFQYAAINIVALMDNTREDGGKLLAPKSALDAILAGHDIPEPELVCDNEILIWKGDTAWKLSTLIVTEAFPWLRKSIMAMPADIRPRTHPRNWSNWESFWQGDIVANLAKEEGWGGPIIKDINQWTYEVMAALRDHQAAPGQAAPKAAQQNSLAKWPEIDLDWDSLQKKNRAEKARDIWRSEIKGKIEEAITDPRMDKQDRKARYHMLTPGHIMEKIKPSRPIKKDDFKTVYKNKNETFFGDMRVIQKDEPGMGFAIQGKSKSYIVDLNYEKDGKKLFVDNQGKYLIKPW